MLPLLIAAALAAPEASAPHEITGRVRHRETGEPIEGALVVLQCTCLAAERITTTNTQGVYRFSHLPSGRYTIHLLHGYAEVVRFITLGKP